MPGPPDTAATARPITTSTLCALSSTRRCPGTAHTTKPWPLGCPDAIGILTYRTGASVRVNVSDRSIDKPLAIGDTRVILIDFSVRYAESPSPSSRITPDPGALGR